MYSGLMKARKDGVVIVCPIVNPPLKTRRTRLPEVYVVKFLCTGAAAARRLERIVERSGQRAAVQRSAVVGVD